MLTVGYNFDGTQSPVVQRLGDAPSGTPVLSVPNFYGAHGHDPKLPDMDAFFAAAGPHIRPGLIHRGVHNVDLVPTVEKLLGVTPAATVEGTPLPIFKK
jgi:predicted AlkP superfamily pyrophosphatase or phosphodiesterase